MARDIGKSPARCGTSGARTGCCVVLWDGSGCSFCEAGWGWFGWGGVRVVRPSEDRKVGGSTPPLATNANTK